MILWASVSSCRVHKQNTNNSIQCSTYICKSQLSRPTKSSYVKSTQSNSFVWLVLAWLSHRAKWLQRWLSTCSVDGCSHHEVRRRQVAVLQPLSWDAAAQNRDKALNSLQLNWLNVRRSACSKLCESSRKRLGYQQSSGALVSAALSKTRAQLAGSALHAVSCFER